MELSGRFSPEQSLPRHQNCGRGELMPFRMNGANAPSPERGSLIWDIGNKDELVHYERKMCKLINN